MTDPDRNPYALLELDSRMDLETLTRALRERAEDADREERVEIQALWQALTLSDRDRAQYAFLARPRGERTDRVGPLLRMVREVVVGDVDVEMLTGQLTEGDLAIPPVFTAPELASSDLPEPPSLAEDPLLLAEEP